MGPTRNRKRCAAAQGPAAILNQAPPDHITAGEDTPLRSDPVHEAGQGR